MIVPQRPSPCSVRRDDRPGRVSRRWRRRPHRRSEQLRLCAAGRNDDLRAAPRSVRRPAGRYGDAPATTSATTTAHRRGDRPLSPRRHRLYYLNGYRGLMVFDVSDVDHPKLLGRSPIFGSPVEMIVRNGIAVVVVADWYGQMDDGTPFHGSIVRGLDATDPTNIKVARRSEARRLGRKTPRRRRRALRRQRRLRLELRLGRDTAAAAARRRLDGPTDGDGRSSSSVSFANNVIAAVGKRRRSPATAASST